MLNGIFQRPYVVKDGRGSVKKKQDDEQTSSASREQQADQNSKSKGLQYAEQNKQTVSPAYQRVQQPGSEQVDWRQMRSQIQNQAQTQKSNYNTQLQSAQTAQTAAVNNSAALQKSSSINIAQIIKDFKNTAVAIGTPDDLKEEVNGYVTLIEAQVKKDNPNVKLIKSNLKNASSLLDGFISQTLNKDSKVVENWVDALFLQQIDFKYNEGDINPQFLVKFPEGSTEKTEKAENKTAVNDTVPEPVEQEIKTEAKVQSLIPQDKELKSLFIQSKKLAYANEPEKAIETFQKALARADEVNDNETKSKIFYEVGRIYDDHDYFAQALKSYNKSLENTSDNNVKTKAHYSMAQIYDDVNQITPALDHYFNSVSFAGEAENLVAQSTSLTKMANIYTDMYEQEAMDYYYVADGLADQT
ncbi:MAG: tetratricopeptide repeat protein, partial [Candidatus Gastranaerophilaceae bacterium]